MGILSLFGAGMALQFERLGDGFVYRANGTGPALPVTEPEIDRYIARGGVSFLLHTLAFGLAVIAAALVTTIWFPRGDEPGGMILMGALLIAIAFALYRSLRWAMFAPARELADRPPLAPPRPARERPRATLRSYKQPRPAPVRRGRRLLLILFVIGEFFGGIAGALLGFALLSGLGQIAGLIGIAVFGLLAVWILDRWCKRLTGESAAEIFQALSQLSN